MTRLYLDRTPLQKRYDPVASILWTSLEYLYQFRLMSQFLDEEISLNMIEMGCIPGTLVTMIRKAPFGDPLAFACHSSIISIRKAEAKTVIVKPENV
jgi:ferrous iron transport protein A